MDKDEMSSTTDSEKEEWGDVLPGPEKISDSETSDSETSNSKSSDPSSENEESACGENGIVALTFATHGGRDDRFCRMLESAMRSNIPLEILGWGDEWKGLWQKLEGSLNRLKSLPSECIVMFTDGFDIIFTSSLEDIKEKFLKHNSTFLSSAECGCWPRILRGRAACYDEYPKAPTLYRYLNSGSWLGRAGHALKLMEKMVAIALSKEDNSDVNDQDLLSDMYVDGTYNITLDHHATIFQSLHSTDPPDLEYCHTYADHMSFNQELGLWENTYTKTQPSVFHFNGGGKKHHLQFEAKLSYTKDRSNRGKPEVRKEISELYDQKLRVKNSWKTFRDICPGYLEKVS
eukprot:CAMPEP_0167746282 /NCGR_PEP_ID=MMETSP0110_2-20121227/3626_1 /TAXON_ID=629695 /ORGANISM="Gymnochlora sp., Strain CCMP2014" /LENGTH=345 /DNA_ID=CAMNT_0007631029 /DNA_START=195 /DNA_END=1232 /DNA_ORIENTATION=+